MYSKESIRSIYALSGAFLAEITSKVLGMKSTPLTPMLGGVAGGLFFDYEANKAKQNKNITNNTKYLSGIVNQRK